MSSSCAAGLASTTTPCSSVAVTWLGRRSPARNGRCQCRSSCSTSWRCSASAAASTISCSATVIITCRVRSPRTVVYARRQKRRGAGHHAARSAPLLRLDLAQLRGERAGVVADARTPVSKDHPGYLRRPFRHRSRRRRGGTGFEVCPKCAQTAPSRSARGVNKPPTCANTGTASVRAEGLEPSRSSEHRHLKPACLPIPSRPRRGDRTARVTDKSHSGGTVMKCPLHVVAGPR